MEHPRRPSRQRNRSRSQPTPSPSESQLCGSGGSNRTPRCNVGTLEVERRRRHAERSIRRVAGRGRAGRELSRAGPATTTRCSNASPSSGGGSAHHSSTAVAAAAPRIPVAVPMELIPRGQLTAAKPLAPRVRGCRRAGTAPAPRRRRRIRRRWPQRAAPGLPAAAPRSVWAGARPARRRCPGRSGGC